MTNTDCVSICSPPCVLTCQPWLIDLHIEKLFYCGQNVKHHEWKQWPVDGASSSRHRLHVNTGCKWGLTKVHILSSGLPVPYKPQFHCFWDHVVLLQTSKINSTWMPVRQTPVHQMRTLVCVRQICICSSNRQQTEWSVDHFPACRLQSLNGW